MSNEQVERVAWQCALTIGQVVPRLGVSTSNPHAVCDRCGDKRADHRPDPEVTP